MTTLTATADNSTASVALEIDQTSVVTSVVRSDATGVYTVRAAAGQFPTPNAGTTLLTDYEARHGLNAYTAYADDVSYRTNLTINGSFEVDTSGWSVASVTPSLYTGMSMVKYGTKCLQLTSTGSGSSPYAYQTVLNVAAGEYFGINAWLASETAGNMQVRLQISWRDSANVSLGNLSSVYTRHPFYAGGWHRVTGQAPAGTDRVVIYLQFRNGDDTANPVAAGQRMWADAVHTAKAATLADLTAQLDAGYFDGSTPEDSDHLYQWLGAAHASAAQETLHTREIVASATLDLSGPWLMVPVAPNYSEQIETITNYSAGRTTNSTFHTIIGRSDPLVVLGKLGTRAGTLEIFADSVADAERVVRVFDRGEAVLLKQTVPGMDLYFVAETVEISPYQVTGEDSRFMVRVSYREVTQPLGNLSGALGWTFDGLSTAFPTFDAVTQAYATFDDLTIDDRK